MSSIEFLCLLFGAVLIPIYITPGYYWWTAFFILLLLALAYEFSARLDSWTEQK